MREACGASSGDDGGWADVGLGAPSTKFACCSWWPDVGAIGLADGARSDQRWIEGTSVGDALETMAAKASKRTRDADDEDDDDELTATTPGEAAARALELIRQSLEPAGRGCYVDVVWITAGVGSDRSDATSTGGANESVGGGGGGERWWPGEAVAAWGVLRAAKAAGARCAVVALAPVTRNSAGDSRTIPATIRAVAARTGAEASLFRGGKSSGGVGAGVGLDPGLRWRGSLLVPSSSNSTTTLTGLSLSAPGSRSIVVRADSQPPASAERRRVHGDMVLLEVVRLEVVPPTHLSSRPALRFKASDEPKAEAEAEAEAATGAAAAAGGGVMRAWTSVVESVPPARAPAFIVRISLGDGSVGSVGTTTTDRTKTTGGKPPPAPHGSGPVLMIYADGSGGFLASALASFPALLRRALVRVRAQREADDSFSLGATPERNRGTGEGVSKAATSAGAGASEMTTESGGGKRLRSSRSGRSSRKTTTTGDNGGGGRGRRGEDEDDSAATRADLGEEALKAVAMMDVNASLNTALDLATVHAATDAKETSLFGQGKRRRRSVRLSQCASRSAGTHSSVGVAHQPGFLRRAYGAEGGVAPPPVHRMLDVLVQRQEAASDDAAAQLCPDDDSYDDVPFLTGVLLKTAADVAAGDDVLRWALRAAGELAASEENGEGCDGEGREIAVADSGGFQEAPSKSGASSHQHVDLALGGAGADDDDNGGNGGRSTPSERARQKDRRERTRTALAPGKKGSLASISGKRGAAILAAAGGGGGGGGRGQTTRGRRQQQPQTQQPQQPEREPSESAAGAGRVAAGTAAAAVAKKCPACDIDLAPIPGMKHCYGCGGPL